MEVRCVSKYIRMSPRKVRLVLDMIRGMDVNQAVALLKFTPKAAAKPVLKSLQSAAANAEENLGLSRDELFVTKATADEGPTLRRGRAGARGRYKPMLKRSSHITVVVAEKSEA